MKLGRLATLLAEDTSTIHNFKDMAITRKRLRNCPVSWFWNGLAGQRSVGISEVGQVRVIWLGMMRKFSAPLYQSLICNCQICTKTCCVKMTVSSSIGKFMGTIAQERKHSGNWSTDIGKLESTSWRICWKREQTHEMWWRDGSPFLQRHKTLPSLFLCLCVLSGFWSPPEKSKRKTLSLNGGPAQESGRFLHQHHTSFADHRLRSEGGEAINKFWHDSLPSELSHSAELCLWLNFPTCKFYILCATRAAIYGVAAVPEGTAT